MVTASSSLRFRALLRTAARRGGLGTPGGAVAGLSTPAQALYIASITATSPVIVVVPTDADAEAMTADIRFFLSGVEGASESDVARAVLPFPSHEVDPYRGLTPHFDVASARARALHGVRVGQARIVVASVAALFPRICVPERFMAASRSIVPGDTCSPTDLGDVLVDGGYRREDPVDEHGEYCVRGGVVDVFPAGESRPFRIEFIGDTVESMRRYDPSTQRSIDAVDRVTLIPVLENPGTEEPATAWLFDYLPAGVRPLTIVSEFEQTKRHGAGHAEQLRTNFALAQARGDDRPAPEVLARPWEEIEAVLSSATRLDALGLDDSPTPTRHVPCQPVIEFKGRIRDWIAEVTRLRDAGETVVLAAMTAGRAERCAQLLLEYGIPSGDGDAVGGSGRAPVLVVTGQLSRGFRLPTAALQIYAETDVFEEERRVRDRRRSVARTFMADFRDLRPGDRIVHVDHGIGMFVGLKPIAVGRDSQEFMELRYANDTKLFVPVERLDLVQKYSGAAQAPLDRLGGTSWERVQSRVRRAMRDMAEELLTLYAARKAVPGRAFSPDSHWQHEFDDAFEYDLTVDQEAAIADIRRDMESAFPMDRLLCGDVGYGKTEVAMRAAFKAVMEGTQVAVLAPTTVLAFQHYKTLHERFAAFPARIAMISRFRSKAEQKATIADLAAGQVDIIVGTHRLLSKDVQFRDLGLLVVDEEQRFGVAHKERIKQMRKRVDVLTMTATPIPRTLNMSLVGIRDMSVIESPPKDRQSIQTSVVTFDTAVIARAIRNEIERGGQIYFVHNRVQSIHSIGALLGRLVPEARVAVAHGQMGESDLERVMVDFVDRRYDVLLATTIIENGLDIPNANTMIVNRADRYGLAQLYQLRGRVGRSDRRAYAYLLVPPDDSLTDVARKRLAAIREFSDLGSGFRIAALDLEIRGAGNLLGGEQTGHIDAVGFEMYMKLLDEAVRELKGEDIEDDTRAAVNLHIDVRIDDDYVPDMNQRLGIYRRIAGARREDEIRAIMDEVRDRYGPPPASVCNLAEYGRIRVMADRLRIESIDRQGQVIVVVFRADSPVDPGRLLALVRARDDLSLSPPATLTLTSGAPRAGGPDGRAAAPPRAATPPRQRERTTASGRAPSWWTARAAAGAAREGFSKEAILRPVQDDPRAPGGIVDRTRQLLVQLSDAAGIG